MKSVKDLNFEILCVSQFTLYGNVNKGNKPDFHESMQFENAKKMYEKVLVQMRKDYDSSKIKDGIFGEMMVVDIQNEGPVTIQLESPKKELK